MRGRDKLLETINGEPLLRRQTRAALATGCEVVVTLPYSDHPRAKALEGLDAMIVPIKNAEDGMSASLAKAAGLCAIGQALMVLLPDVPGITTREIDLVLKTFDACKQSLPVQALNNSGKGGTPVVFPAHLLARFDTLTGDRGAKGLLRGERVQTVAFEDDRATRDLDTPEDWNAWRKDTGIAS